MLDSTSGAKRRWPQSSLINPRPISHQQQPLVRRRCVRRIVFAKLVLMFCSLRAGVDK